MGNQHSVDDAAARFASQVADAEIGLAARKNHGDDNDEPYDPMRALVVNSLCFLVRIFTLTGGLIFSVPGLIGLAVLTTACLKIIKSRTAARWVINATIFFMTGTICSILFLVLALPLTVLIAKVGSHFLS